jgi:small subunit ribosomal protein S17
MVTKQNKTQSMVKSTSSEKKSAANVIKTRGRTFVGTVTSDKMSRTVVVHWERRFYVKKFERYERRQSKVNAHNPEEIGAKKGDIVKIVETRPLSKTKHFIVTEILGKASAKQVVKIENIEEATAAEELAAKKKENKSKDNKDHARKEE